MKKVRVCCLAALLAGLAAPPEGGAIGIVYTGVGGDGRELMELTSVEVEVTIQDRVAVTRMDQVFTNKASRQAEGIYEFALPAGAIITDLVLWIGDRRVQGIIMEQHQARQIYDAIVRRNVDPALVETLGDGRFRLSIFPFPAAGSRRVELEYTQVLEGRDGVMAYRFPLEAESEQTAQIERFALNAVIGSQHPIQVQVAGAFAAATVVERLDALRTRLFFADEQVRAEDGFELVVTETGELGRPRVLSYRAPGADMGYYALWLPPLELDESQPLPRSVTFVIDISSSMRGDKLPAVQRALVKAIGALQEDDFFNIITFSNGAAGFADQPVAATADNKGRAANYVQQLAALGGTNFEAALRLALPQEFPEGRFNHLILLTDGQPSVGSADLSELGRMVGALGGGQVRIFAIGVGNDVNRGFLQALSADHNGTSRYVSTDGDIEVELRRLFSELTRPVFLPTELALDGVDESDVFPSGVEVLAAGQELFQVGRYAAGGTLTLRLRGQANQRDMLLEYPLEFAVEDVEQPLIARLWAQQKVEALERHIARFGAEPELLDDILDLGLTYHLVTRRTSLFAPDDDIIVNPEPREEDFFGAATAVEEAVGTTSWLDKEFYWRDPVWVDVDYRAAMPLVAYNPAAGQPAVLDEYARLGEEMIVVWQQTAYVLKAGALPQQPLLRQNFPNPFNSGTVIRYTLPNAGDVALDIYNLAGQKVVGLEQGYRPAGAYRIAWDGRDDQGRAVVSGTYLYRLRVGSLVQTRKLLLLK